MAASASLPSSPPDHASPERGRISVAQLRKDLGISRERMARLLDVSARTIQRWEEQDQLPSNRWVMQVLVDVQNIVDLGLQVFEPRGVRLIMTTPQPGFGNKSGLDLVEAGRAGEVFGYLAGAYEGFPGT